MIAQNLDAAKAFSGTVSRFGFEEEEFERLGGRVAAFAGQTVLADLATGQLLPTYRCKPSSHSDDPADFLHEFATSMADWLLHVQSPAGQIPYKYWPSKEMYSATDNPIRQFMTTIAIARAAKVLGSRRYEAAALSHLSFNLARFCSMHGSCVMVMHDGKAKLGSAAMAGMAILEIEGDKQPTHPLLEGLRHLIDMLWQPDGSFRTFYEPPDRNDNQNFYPGEALLFWAKLMERGADDELRRRFMISFRYYQQWHFSNRNPAFVPWHTQAYVLAHKLRPHPELATAVFAMNDWLLQLQQGNSAPYSDMVGRFYCPQRTDFGPPHASSTAVYIEGLSDALTLALDLGEAMRAGRYRDAIAKGLSNLRLLQFRSSKDAFYVGQPSRLLGSIKTNPYDNTIRIDNVQHTLMAVLKNLSTPVRHVVSDSTAVASAQTLEDDQ